jgi:hypothetical protein
VLELAANCDVARSGMNRDPLGSLQFNHCRWIRVTNRIRLLKRFGECRFGLTAMPHYQPGRLEPVPRFVTTFTLTLIGPHPLDLVMLTTIVRRLHGYLSSYVKRQFDDGRQSIEVGCDTLGQR